MTLEVKAPAPDWSTGSRPRENTGVAGNPAPIFTAPWRPPQGYPDWSENRPRLGARQRPAARQRRRVLGNGLVGGS
jgi:hypothetical protein